MTALDASCPGAYCGNDAVNTEPLVDSANVCPNLVPETLSTFKYLHNGVNYTLIEIRGPSDPLDAADLVIAAPHGGDLRDEVDDFIEDRNTSGSYCPDGCKTSKDSYTKEIAEVSTIPHWLMQNNQLLVHWYLQLRYFSFCSFYKPSSSQTFARFLILSSVTFIDQSLMPIVRLERQLKVMPLRKRRGPTFIHSSTMLN